VKRDLFVHGHDCKAVSLVENGFIFRPDFTRLFAATWGTMKLFSMSPARWPPDISGPVDSAVADRKVQDQVPSCATCCLDSEDKRLRFRFGVVTGDPFVDLDVLQELTTRIRTQDGRIKRKSGTRNHRTLVGMYSADGIAAGRNISAVTP